MVTRLGQNQPARARQRNFELLREIVSVIAILYGLVIVVSGYTYITTDVDLFSWAEEENGFEDADSWRACEILCREAVECQSFEYQSGGCSLSSDVLIYGSLDDSDGGISGQLVSKSDSSLAWAGFGKFGGKRKHLTPGCTHAECQAACDEFERCIGYSLIDDDTNCDLFTFAYRNSIENNSENAKHAIRSDINGSESEIMGDVLDTRVAAKDIPVAPSDINNAVPDYILADFHFSDKMENWKKMASVVAETSQQCSNECHNTEFCLSFVFRKDKDNNVAQCDMYDAAILGRVRTGTDKYGVIDRWQGKGAVSSLVGFRHEGNGLAGSQLLSYSYDNERTTDECATLCQKFHEPRVCIAFFFHATFKECYLYDSLPCVGPRGANSKAFEGGTWHEQNFQFGYFGKAPSVSRIFCLENRIPNQMISTLANCPIEITPTQTDDTSQSQIKLETGDAPKTMHDDKDRFRSYFKQTSNRSTKCAVHFRMHSGGCVVTGVSPKKEVPIDMKGALPSRIRLRCLHHCYYERAWCKAFVMDFDSKICKMYDVKGTVSGGKNCQYGVATTP